MAGVKTQHLLQSYSLVPRRSLNSTLPKPSLWVGLMCGEGRPGPLFLPCLASAASLPGLAETLGPDLMCRALQVYSLSCSDA